MLMQETTPATIRILGYSSAWFSLLSANCNPLPFVWQGESSGKEFFLKQVILILMQRHAKASVGLTFQECNANGNMGF
jgi:hypothetical protein